jgi:hypothetical protein
VAEFKRLTEAVEDYRRQRESRGMASNTVVNEMFVLRRFAAWYGDADAAHERRQGR